MLIKGKFFKVPKTISLLLKFLELGWPTLTSCNFTYTVFDSSDLSSRYARWSKNINFFARSDFLLLLLLLFLMQRLNSSPAFAEIHSLKILVSFSLQQWSVNHTNIHCKNKTLVILGSPIPLLGMKVKYGGECNLVTFERINNHIDWELSTGSFHR